MSSSTPLSPAARAAACLGWVLVCAVGSSLVGLASHVGATLLMSAAGQRGLARALSASMTAAVALACVLLGCLLLAAAVPVLKPAARRVCLLTAGLLVSGLPVAMLALAPSLLYGASDLRQWADAAGLPTFFLWVRVLTEGWRGALVVWDRPSPPVAVAAPPYPSTDFEQPAFDTPVAAVAPSPGVAPAPD